MSKSVLVVSESFGLGHERAAKALITGISLKDPGVRISHINSLSTSFPRLTTVFLRLYLQFIKSFPHTWHRFYQKSRVNRNSESTDRLMFRLLSDGIKKALLESRADAVVCTHPFPATVVSRLKDEGLDIPLAGIITDYDIHACWLDKNIDLYITGDNSLKKQFIEHGTKNESVTDRGIPIDPAFCDRLVKEEARSRLGLPTGKQLVTVAGGGWGLGDLGQIAVQLAEMPEKPQVVVITGINTQLRQKLHRLFYGLDNVMVEGLVSNMHEYMMAADILVTKPGGLTSSEALAAGLPMVIFDVLYGQEAWNANFLTERGAAVKCSHTGEIAQEVRRLLQNAEVRSRLMSNALAIGKPASGLEAADGVLQLLAY